MSNLDWAALFRKHMSEPKHVWMSSEPMRITAHTPVTSDMVDELISIVNHANLEQCAADVAALFRTYQPGDWRINRMGNMEFLSDQMFTREDRLAPVFCQNPRARIDLDRYGYLGYII